MKRFTKRLVILWRTSTLENITYNIVIHHISLNNISNKVTKNDIWRRCVQAILTLDLFLMIRIWWLTYFKETIENANVPIDVNDFFCGWLYSFSRIFFIARFLWFLTITKLDYIHCDTFYYRSRETAFVYWWNL